MYSIGQSNGLYTLDVTDVTDGSTTLSGGPTGYAGLTFSADYSTLYTLGTADWSLYTVNALTGAATLVGAFVNADVFDGLIDLGTDSLGQIYGIGLDGHVYTLNGGTGEATHVALTGVLHGFAAISFDENDTLLGITTNGDSLMTINTSTGATPLIGGDIGGDVRGMAFVLEPSTVPLPAGLPLLGLGCLGVAGARRRQA